MMNMVWRDGGVPADSFYEARTECAEGPKSKFKIKVWFGRFQCNLFAERNSFSLNNSMF